jgi:ribosome-associated protein
MAKATPNIDPEMRHELRGVVRAIEDKKGESIRVLDVRGKSTVTDFLVLATGTSDPHLKAIKSAVDDSLEAAHTAVLGEDRNLASGWVVVDAFDFMVHLQTAPVREFYGLDQLWRDAREVDLGQ